VVIELPSLTREADSQERFTVKIAVLTYHKTPFCSSLTIFVGRIILAL
jgi:hypothetical protein